MGARYVTEVPASEGRRLEGQGGGGAEGGGAAVGDEGRGEGAAAEGRAAAEGDHGQGGHDGAPDGLGQPHFELVDLLRGHVERGRVVLEPRRRVEGGVGDAGPLRSDAMRRRQNGEARHPHGHGGWGMGGTRPMNGHRPLQRMSDAPPPPCVTFRRVVASLRGPGQSPVRPFACCVGSLRSVGRSRSPVFGVLGLC